MQALVGLLDSDYSAVAEIVRQDANGEPLRVITERLLRKAARVSYTDRAHFFFLRLSGKQDDDQDENRGSNNELASVLMSRVYQDERMKG